MSLEKYMIPCISKTLFGIECLGCGFQRALILIFNGEFQNAFKMYPAIYTCLLLLLVTGIRIVFPKQIHKKSLVVLIFINSVIMITGYYYKHFL